MLGVLFTPAPASAHPLDQYLLAAYLTPAPSVVTVELDVSPGVLVAPRALADLDPDGDGAISDREAAAFAATLAAHLELRADGTPLPLAVTGIDVPPYLTIRAGYGTLRLHATAAGAPSSPGAHELAFRNTFAPPGAVYQVNAVVGRSRPAEVGVQQRDAAQQRSRIEYRIDAAAPVPAVATDRTTAPARAGRLLETLRDPALSGLAVLFALGLAALLGALHALTPGHAKTLMAAYLVGGEGTTRNALTLGAVITATHTASVILIGLLALFASRFLVPGVLVPALEVLSGVLVLAIGLRLLWRRVRLLRGHDHAREREPALVGAAHTHEHGGRSHTHAVPAGGITPRNLFAVGVSGGLVPCPEALGVMILAVGVNRTVFGLGLILSFSVGLAAVLMGLGILLIRARRLVGRFERLGTRWTAVLPAVSALVVTALGAGLLVNGLTGP